MGKDIIEAKYSLHKLIDSGSTAKILAVKDNSNGKIYVAKVDVDRYSEGSSRLAKEYSYYKRLEDCKYVPNVYGLHHILFNGVQYNALIMDLVGPNI